MPSPNAHARLRHCGSATIGERYESPRLSRTRRKGSGRPAQAGIREPRDAIVKIVKTTICGTDLHILKGDVPTCAPGRILGHEGVGVVDAVGAGVTAFRPATAC